MLSRTAGGIGLLATIALAMTACAPAQPSCREPVAPPLIDAFSATDAQMNQMRGTVIHFQKQSDDFQTCIVHAINAYHSSPPLMGRVFDDGYVGGLDKRVHQNQALKEKVVGQFNDAVRAYNDLHPG